MGLREKIALLIVALSFLQITRVECASSANKLKSSMKMISKPKRTKWTKSKNLGNPSTAEESLKRGFNFPEVDYPLPPTFISSAYYNPKLDFTNNQVVKDSGRSMKNIAQQSINKKNRKYNGSFKSPKKSYYVTYSEEKGAQMPFCLDGKDFFPSVDYPLDASELWKTHYWERILNTQPDVIQKSTNSKAKMKLLLSKAGTKGILKSNVPNSTRSGIDVTINHKESNNQALPNTKEGIILKPIASNNKKSSNNTEFASNPDRLNATKGYNNEKLQIESNRTESSDLSNCDEKYITEQLYSIAQVTPSPMDTTSPYHEQITSVPTTILPLTTVSPFSTDINNIVPTNELINSQETHCSELNSPEIETEENGLDWPADEDGCTVIYPEVFSSLTTSTMAPIYSNVESIWMDPELDNHTLNTYSDEVEQYYILV